MNRLRHVNQFTLFVLVGFAGIAFTVVTAAPEPSFQKFLPSFEQGINRFLNGDAQLWKRNASQTENATIMGAWGAYEKGWNEANKRYDWAVARFKDSGAKVDFEYITSEVSGDLAYTVAIERSKVLLVDQERPSPMTLRVTHIYRRENGEWKMVHRHADPLMDKTAPGAVLK